MSFYSATTYFKQNVLTLEIQGFLKKWPGMRDIKGKSAIHIARTYAGHRHNFIGQNFWARGYFVSTVDRYGEVA